MVEVPGARAGYVFEDRWHVPAAPERVHATLVDVERYVEWWPQIVAVGYLGEREGLVLCRSALPYVLTLVLREVDRSPARLEVAVSGDLEGSVRFGLAPEGTGTRLDLHQEVQVTGLLGLASRVARPLLTWNHDRMMAGCIDGLTARLTAGG